MSKNFDPDKNVFMVSDLIKQGKWDSDLVEDSFNERDPACILSIPLSNYTEDSFFGCLRNEGYIRSSMPIVCYRRLCHLSLWIQLVECGGSSKNCHCHCE